jgi:glycosyltransferase involved in cell wall biosynthesis
MTAVWNYIQRDRICGYSLWQEVTNGLEVNPWGETPGLSKMADNTDHLKQLYQNASVFLNTTLWSSCPFSLLEAMSIGCPIVTTATTCIPEFIENGKNGFVTNDPVTMKKYLEDLIEDKDMALEIGAAGRETILEQFGQQQFLDAWNEAFLKVAQCPTGRLV